MRSTLMYSTIHYNEPSFVTQRVNNLLEGGNSLSNSLGSQALGFLQSKNNCKKCAKKSSN